MTAFQTDDYYNVIAEHVIEAGQEDAKLGTGGTLAIKTWEAEHREGIEDYNNNELPAISCTVDLSAETEDTLGRNTNNYGLSIFIVVEGGRLKNVTQSVKAYAARFERVMSQQLLAGKQLSDVTTDLLDSVGGSVVVSKLGSAIGGGTVGQTLRGVAALTFQVSIDFNIVED